MFDRRGEGEESAGQVGRLRALGAKERQGWGWWLEAPDAPTCLPSGSLTTACPTSTSGLRSAHCSWRCCAWQSAWCGVSSGTRTSECTPGPGHGGGGGCPQVLWPPRCLTGTAGAGPAPGYEKPPVSVLDAVATCCPGADRAQLTAARPWLPCSLSTAMGTVIAIWHEMPPLWLHRGACLLSQQPSRGVREVGSAPLNTHLSRLHPLAGLMPAAWPGARVCVCPCCLPSLTPSGTFSELLLKQLNAFGCAAGWSHNRFNWQKENVKIF